MFLAKYTYYVPAYNYDIIYILTSFDVNLNKLRETYKYFGAY